MIFSIFLEYCAYNEGSGNGIEKMKVDGELDLQQCANKCFKMRMNGKKDINGATLDGTTCYCEVSQTRTWYSKEKTNCQFKTYIKPIKGNFGVYLLLYM